MEHTFEPEPLFDTAANNGLQIELLKRFSGTEENKIPEWIQTYGRQFAKIIDRHPDLLDEWKRNPQTAVANVEKKLYGEDGRAKVT